MAADEPYLQLEARMVNEPYQWLLSTGDVIRKGLSNQAAQIAVAPRVGQENYVLEMLWGSFSVTVPTHCWTLPAEQFGGCVTIGDRKDSAWQRELAETLAQQDATRKRNRDLRVAWVYEQVEPNQIPRILEAALSEHQRWLATDDGRAAPEALSCRGLAATLAAAPSQSTLPRHAMLKGETDAIAVYAQAAREGNWRAAGGLFDAMLADEDFESAYVVVAWLLSNGIPAGYYKLGRLQEATSGYMAQEIYGSNGRMRSDATVMESLRRQAAWLGDPVAQKDVADLLEESGDQANAERWRVCAMPQNTTRTQY